MTLDFTKPLYFLAPLAGLTDLPFRSVVKKFGVDVTVSEMISSNALAYKSQKTIKMLTKSPLENPYSIQIAGSDEAINAQDGVDIVDLNCGCPVPKVVNNLQGSALLTDLKKMGKAIETIKKYSNKKYTSVKIRLGFDKKNHLEIAKVCQESGADFIAVHGRTRSGKFKAPVDYDAIAQIKELLDIPVIANGDIDSPAKAKWVLKHTKCDGIMIGRAAVGRPWIFKEIKENLEVAPKELVAQVVLEHFEQMLNFYGDYGVILFRKHLHTYSKYGYKNATAFRDLVNRVTNVNETKEIIQEFFTNNTLFTT